MCLCFLLNIIFILSTKKVSELNFCSRLKIYALMVSKLLDLLFFSVKKVCFNNQENFFVQGIYPSQEYFLQKIWSSKFSTVKEISQKDLALKIFHIQETFPQTIWSRKCSTKYLIKEILHSQENFPQKVWLRKSFLSQRNFPQIIWYRRFSTKTLSKC